MAEKQSKMSNGQWEILPERERDAVPCRFGVKSWLYGRTRIFAILIYASGRAMGKQSYAKKDHRIIAMALW